MWINISVIPAAKTVSIISINVSVRILNAVFICSKHETFITKGIN